MNRAVHVELDCRFANLKHPYGFIVIIRLSCDRNIQFFARFTHTFTEYRSSRCGLGKHVDGSTSPQFFASFLIMGVGAFCSGLLFRVPGFEILHGELLQS